MKKRFTAMILCMIMIAMMLPVTVFAAGGDKSIMLGASNISSYDSTNGYDYIYYGTWGNDPIKWRVLDNQTNTGTTGLFLLTDTLLGSGSNGDLNLSNTSPNGNSWQSSNEQAWCRDFAGIEGNGVTDAFSINELAAVQGTTKSDRGFTCNMNAFASSDNILNGDKVFFLSAEEANNADYGFTDNGARVANYGVGAGKWWLRSRPYFKDSIASGVNDSGSVGTVQIDDTLAARPAFNLNLNSVLFTSAADNSGQNATLAAPADYSGNEWKVTLKDANSFAEGASVNKATVAPGETLQVTHKALSGFTDAGYTNVTAAISDGDGKLLYYGSVGSEPDATSSDVTIPAELAE